MCFLFNLHLTDYYQSLLSRVSNGFGKRALFIFYFGISYLFTVPTGTKFKLNLNGKLKIALLCSLVTRHRENIMYY